MCALWKCTGTRYPDESCKPARGLLLPDGLSGTSLPCQPHHLEVFTSPTQWCKVTEQVTGAQCSDL